MDGAGSQEAPPAPAGARFVNVPSQGPALAFDTVRAPPRAPDATREPETFQTVDPSDLEEMLTVAFRKSLDVIKAVEHPAPTCAEPWRDPNVTMVLAQIEAEAEARTPDIKATTTLVSALGGVGTSAFCDAVSTDERRLSARRSGTGSVDVYEQAGGAETPVTAQVEAARRGAVTTAVQGFRAWDQYRDEYALEQKPREMFRTRIGVPCHGKLLGVDTSGSWVPSQRAVVYDAAGPMEAMILSAASDGEAPMSPEVLAALVVGALRETAAPPDALKRISVTSLVAPRPGSWAAAHPGRKGTWAGRVPAVRVNVLLWSGHGHYMRCIFLSTCDGAEWSVFGTKNGRIVLAAKDLGTGPSAPLAGPSQSSAAPRVAASRRGFVCRPSDDVCLSFTAVRSNPRPRDAKPKIETFLNMDMDDVEAAVEVALEQVEDIMSRTTTLYPSGETCEVSGVLVQVEAEALSLSRDFRVTATLVDDLGPGTSLFCKAMSTAERRVFAEKNEDGAWRVYTTRTVDGVESAPIDCTEEVERARRFAKHTADQALAAHRCAAAAAAAAAAGENPPCGYLFRTEIVARGMFVAAKEDLSDKQPCTKIQVQAEWHKEHPTIITTSRLALGPSAANAVFLVCEGPPGQACITVRPFRADDVLKQLCKDALMAPLSYGCAAAHPKRAWNKRGEFPAVKVNVLSYYHPQDGLSHKVFLSLPEGKEWRLKPPLKRAASDDGRHLVVHDTSDGAEEPAPSLTWQDFFAIHGCNDGVDNDMSGKKHTGVGDASAATASSADKCAFCAPKPHALCDPAAAPQGARFVCAPGDALSFGFKTVRAQPRPVNARPSQETFLNVPLEDLEELLRVTFSFVRAIKDPDSKTPPKLERPAVLTRIGPESLAGYSDIRATSTFNLPDDSNVDFFCRAISVDGRRLSARKGADGKWRVTATFDADGKVVGPFDCSVLIKGGGYDALYAMARATDAYYESDSDELSDKLIGPCGFRKRSRSRHEGLDIDIITDVVMSPEQPDMLFLGNSFPRNACGELPPESAFRAAMSCPDFRAKQIVTVLRRLGAVESLAARVPERAGGTGGASAVTVNMVYGFGDYGMPLVWLSLPEGARWTLGAPPRAPRSRPGSEPAIIPVGVEVFDREAFHAEPSFSGMYWLDLHDMDTTLRNILPRLGYEPGPGLDELCNQEIQAMLRETEQRALNGPDPERDEKSTAEFDALLRQFPPERFVFDLPSPSTMNESCYRDAIDKLILDAMPTVPASRGPGSFAQPRAPPAPAVGSGQQQGGSKKKKKQNQRQRQRAKLQANRGDKE